MTEDDAPSHADGGRALLQGLDLEQRQAVTSPPGPLLVIAGAGSGKRSRPTIRT
jgi:hypothetical protein